MNLKTMLTSEFDETSVFLLSTVVKELPDEAADAIGDLRKEVITLVRELDKVLADLTKEREANNKKDMALEWYAIPYNYSTDHLSQHGYIPIDKDGGKLAREAIGKTDKDYETAGECAWCDEISSELRHSHQFDRADNGGKMCRICWDMDRETYKGSYDTDIGPFDNIEGNEPNEG